MEKKCIVRVRENKNTGQKTITIPNEFENIKKDDLVEVRLVEIK